MSINRAKELLLQHNELIKMLYYDKDSGIFTWIVNRGKTTKVGDIAGTLTKRKYIRIKINSIGYLAHRLAWFYVTGSWPENQIDHKDTIKYHNWFDNLRNVTNTQNKQNQQTAQSNNNSESNMCGVTYRKDNKKWRVCLRIDRKLLHFGHFNTQLEAENKCIEMRRKYMEGNLL